MLKVALVQRILAPYRAGVFRRLAMRPGIDLTVFHGHGSIAGQTLGLDGAPELQTHRLIGMSAKFRLREREYFLMAHPALVPRVASGRFDVVLAEGITNLPNNMPLVAWCRLTGTPLAIWDQGRFPGRSMGPLRRLAEPLWQRILRDASVCIGYGDSSVRYFKEVGIPDDRVFLARNTFDLDPVQSEVNDWLRRPSDITALRNELGLPEGRIIIHVGSLHASKPLDPLLAACANLEPRYGPLGLLVIGNGPDRHRLETIASRLGLRGARFLGHIPAGEGLAPYALMSGLAVYPSRATLGVITMLGHGVPVIAGRDQSPEEEAIQYGVNGTLIEPGSLKDVENALAAWLSGTMSLSTHDSIREAAWEHWSVDRMVDGLEEAVRYAAGSHGTRSAHGGGKATRAC